LPLFRHCEVVHLQVESKVEMRPKISVIIPTYNRRLSIEVAIKSVLSQSYKEFELIIIDDGSTDKTKELIEFIDDRRIQYFYQENQGSSVARNLGVEKSEGDFIAFLDSDDCWLEDKLEKQFSFLKNTKNDMPGCATGYFINKLNGKKEIIQPAITQTSLRSILKKNILHICTTFMCDRKVFDDVGYFDTHLKRGQDTDWLIRYRKIYDIGVVRKPLAIFNQHLPKSAKTYEQSQLYFLNKHKENLRAQGEVFYRRKIAISYTKLAYQFYRKDLMQKAKEFALKALRAYPIVWPGLYLILLDVYFGTRLKHKMDSIRYPKGLLLFRQKWRN